MKSKLLKGIYVILISSVITYGLYRLVNYISPPSVKKVDASWVEVIGVITKIGYGRSGVGYIEFDLNGQHHRVTAGKNLFASVVGEKYPVIVNPANPKELIIKEWQPIFEESEKTNWVGGRITYFDCSYLDDKYRTPYTADCGIEYEYEVNGRKYKRYQTLPPKVRDSSYHWKVGERYYVQYLEANPQRGSMEFARHEIQGDTSQK